MKRRIITMVAMVGILFGCDNPPARSTASVRTVHGLYIFINADPSAGYNPLGEEIKLDAIREIVDSTKNKKDLFAKAGTILWEGFNDIDFASKLERMVDRVRDKYPDAEGVIFEGKMNACQAIKFK